MSEETEFKVKDRVCHYKRAGMVTKIEEIKERPCRDMDCCPDYYDCPELGTRCLVELDDDPVKHVIEVSDLKKFDRRVELVKDADQSTLFP